MYSFLRLLHIWVCHCLTCSQALTALYIFWVTSLVYIAKTHNQGAILGADYIFMPISRKQSSESVGSAAGAGREGSGLHWVVCTSWIHGD